LDGINDEKGTFTTSGNTLTTTPTHYWGEMFYLDLDAKWYSKAQLKAAGKATEEDFVPSTYTYAISGTTLTLTPESGTIPPLTKQ